MLPAVLDKCKEKKALVATELAALLDELGRYHAFEPHAEAFVEAFAKPAPSTKCQTARALARHLARQPAAAAKNCKALIKAIVPCLSTVILPEILK